MLSYYDWIMGTNEYEKNFLNIFNKLWEKEIKSQNLPYTNAEQIKTGNRLRPLLMAWGYYANCNSENNSYIADYAISIELLHKASILLDDLIDEDIARHEKKTFHMQYSKSEAILYALYILNRSITLIHEKDITSQKQYTSILLKIIDCMSQGGIKEVNTKKTILNIADVKEIIELETVTLIENSFIIGYQLSSQYPVNIPDAIIQIGHHCGYCFQVLNDIEPFSAPQINQKYKGTLNYDFEKNRKNIVISFLFGCCTQSERNKLINNSDFIYVDNLIKKYDVLEAILKQLDVLILEIMQYSLYFKNNNLGYYIEFKKFIYKMFKICFQKCGLPLKEELFNN